MLQFFRNFFKSKVGMIITLAFLALIAVAFASGDVANMGGMGTVSAGDRVAVVGDREVDANDLFQNTSNAINRIRQDDPTMSTEAFIADGGMDDLMDALVSRNAIAAFGEINGIRVGRDLVDSEIRNRPEFRGLDGTFNEDSFRTLLTQMGLTEQLVRDDLAMGLFSRQILIPIQTTPKLPLALAERYARLETERRVGNITAVQAGPFIPNADPTEEQLQAFYDSNQDRYIRPERRVLRYAVFGDEAVGEIPPPTAEDIAARYEADNDQYVERETRSFTQLVVTTQAAAQAIADEVNAGKSLEQSAREKTFGTSSLAMMPQEELAELTSETVAEAAFAASSGSVSVPAQGELGWYVLRVDDVQTQRGRSLEEVTPLISAQIEAEARREMLNEMTAEIEDSFQSGNSLSEVAEQLGLQLQSTPELTATGQIYGQPANGPAVLAPVISYAFELQEGDREIVEVEAGTTFLIFDVSNIVRSAAAPLDEIANEVEAAWRIDEGMNGAKEAANRIIARVEEGSSLREAVAAEEKNLLRPDSLDISRQEVAQQGQLPPAFELYFSMAPGTVKTLESPQSMAWFVIQLEEIQSEELDENHPFIELAQTQLGALLPNEYTEQYFNAVQDSIEIEINQDAVDGVVDQLTGNNN